MKQLIKKSWADFQKIKTKHFVIPNSIPILWFGDLNAYVNSNSRIITVGINPSNIEFLPSPRHGVYSVNYRFPLAKSLVGKNSLTNSDIQLYEDAMNAYFKNTKNGKPTWYKPWFGSYETALNALNASYISNSNYQNTAIHVDLCCPFATSKWSGLTQADKCLIQSCQCFSFQDLIKVLNPHIIITCMNRVQIGQNYIDVNGNPCQKINALFNFEKLNSNNNRTIAYIRVHRLQSGQVLIWGNNGTTPFAFFKKGEINNQIGLIKKNLNIP